MSNLVKKHKERVARAEDKAEIKNLVEANQSLERELAAKNAITADSYVIKPFDGKISESTAVVLASDWHIEENVVSATVNGLNSFNLGIAKRRIENFFKVTLRLVQIERKNTPIHNLVLWLGGDFISGSIHDELLETCSLRPVEAANRALEHIQSGIDFILKSSDLTLIIPCSAGNHSRMTKKVHASTELGNSLELFVYNAIALRYADNPRVKVIVSPSYHTYITVYGKVIRFHHGHALRYQGGVGGLTIPVNKAIAQWNKSKQADYDCFGHWHQCFYGGNFICNGSLIGFNPFAIRIKASFERPKQAFFVLNQKYGEVIAFRPILV